MSDLRYDLLEDKYLAIEDEAGLLRAELDRLRAELAKVTEERDALVDAVVTGPLKGKTASEAIIALRGEVAELLAGADADALMLTQVGRERDAAVQRAEQAEGRLAELIQIGDDVTRAVSDWSDGDDAALDRVNAKHGDRREVLRIETIRDAVSKAEAETAERIIAFVVAWAREVRAYEIADLIEAGAWRGKEAP